MIRFAEPGDHPRLKALWAEAFGDAQKDIDAYFARRHEDRNMLLDARDGELAGMLTMLPVTLQTSGGRAYPARYVFAVATGTRFRRRGVSTALLEAAHTQRQSAGDAAAVLVPATAALFDFYGKRGYTAAFFTNELTLRADELPPCPEGAQATVCSAEEYKRIRDLAFRDSRLYARWDEAAVAYALDTFQEAGGVAALSWAGGLGCAAWEQTEDGVQVKELALIEGDAKAALSVLHGALRAKRYTARLAQGTVPGAASQPFGMIHWLIPEPSLACGPPYIGLAKD
jgi:GNAT superfamily N-acetyltransferase